MVQPQLPPQQSIEPRYEMAQNSEDKKLSEGMEKFTLVSIH